MGAEPFSDFIVFADESGDHGMERIDPQFPVFSLVFCIFDKEAYLSKVEPEVRRLKMAFFGHDTDVLHESDIRKEKGCFAILRTDPLLRHSFYDALNRLMTELPVAIVAAVIRKDLYLQRYPEGWSPYRLAMQFCMERLVKFLRSQEQNGRLVHVIFEARGREEDRVLADELAAVASHRALWGRRRVDFQQFVFEPLFVPKAANHSGHQVADLIARPLALRVLRPDQSNRAVDIVEDRIRSFKIFP